MLTSILILINWKMTRCLAPRCMVEHAHTMVEREEARFSIGGVGKGRHFCFVFVRFCSFLFVFVRFNKQVTFSRNNFATCCTCIS